MSKLGVDFSISDHFCLYLDLCPGALQEKCSILGTVLNGNGTNVFFTGSGRAEYSVGMTV